MQISAQTSVGFCLFSPVCSLKPSLCTRNTQSEEMRKCRKMQRREKHHPESHRCSPRGVRRTFSACSEHALVCAVETWSQKGDQAPPKLWVQCCSHDNDCVQPFVSIKMHSRRPFCWLRNTPLCVQVLIGSITLQLGIVRLVCFSDTNTASRRPWQAGVCPETPQVRGAGRTDPALPTARWLQA